jgi:hypothetical protein
MRLARLANLQRLYMFISTLLEILDFKRFEDWFADGKFQISTLLEILVILSVFQL